MSKPPIREFPLDNLMLCNQCGAPMELDHSPIPIYTCNRRTDEKEPCPAPSLRARELNLHINSQIARVLMREEDLDRFRQTVTQDLAQRGQGPPDDEDLWATINADQQWLIPEDPAQARRARERLEGFIRRIQIGKGEALIEYMAPLPPGTPRAGTILQEIGLPTFLLA